MAPLSSVAVSTAAIIIAVVVLLTAQTGAATWCVARSDASDQALQTALDYACWAGADCAPILTNGLCFLPNTLIAHASYAFNSYFQRKNMAPGSCDFSGTATVAKTDPSYGSCVYPASPSTAGGTVPPGGPGTSTPTTISVPPPPFGGTTPMYGGGGLTPGMGMGPVLPSTDNSSTSKKLSVTTTIYIHLPFFVVLWFCLSTNVVGF